MLLLLVLLFSFSQVTGLPGVGAPLCGPCKCRGRSVSCQGVAWSSVADVFSQDYGIGFDAVRLDNLDWENVRINCAALAGVEAIEFGDVECGTVWDTILYNDCATVTTNVAVYCQAEPVGNQTTNNSASTPSTRGPTTGTVRPFRPRPPKLRPRPPAAPLATDNSTTSEAPPNSTDGTNTTSTPTTTTTTATVGLELEATHESGLSLGLLVTIGGGGLAGIGVCFCLGWCGWRFCLRARFRRRRLRRMAASMDFGKHSSSSDDSGSEQLVWDTSRRDSAVGTGSTTVSMEMPELSGLYNRRAVTRSQTLSARLGAASAREE